MGLKKSLKKIGNATKYVALATIDTAINASGGNSNLLGSVLGYDSAKNVDKTNKMIAENTNMTNYRIAQQANALNQNLVNQQNEYNSPAQQMERLKQAGLNPSLMYGSITSGNQSNIASVAVPHMQAYRTTTDKKFTGLLASVLRDNYRYRREKQELDLMKDRVEIDKSRAETYSKLVEDSIKYPSNPYKILNKNVDKFLNNISGSTHNSGLITRSLLSSLVYFRNLFGLGYGRNKN